MPVISSTYMAFTTHLSALLMHLNLTKTLGGRHDFIPILNLKKKKKKQGYREFK